jgi:hypothetical protein
VRPRCAYHDGVRWLHRRRRGVVTKLFTSRFVTRSAGSPGRSLSVKPKKRGRALVVWSGHLLSSTPHRFFVCVDRFAGQGEKAGLDILLGPGKQRQERSRSFDHCWGGFTTPKAKAVCCSLLDGGPFSCSSTWAFAAHASQASRTVATDR